MKNEPVAWINRKGEFMPEKVDSFDIPLYTHSGKELTDEEIMSEWEESKDEVEFARAILRKTQEK